jgi:hypothetical protein
MGTNKFLNGEGEVDLTSLINEINALSEDVEGKLQYQPPIEPSAPTNINAGAICFFQNVDDEINITKTDYARFEPVGGAGGGQILNCSGSLKIYNCPSVETKICDVIISPSTITDGDTTLILFCRRDLNEGTYIYSSGGAGIPTYANVNRIALSSAQLARTETTYFYKFICDNVGLEITTGGSGGSGFYPFRSNYSISPALNECIEVIYVFSRNTNEWVRCKQTI